MPIGHLVHSQETPRDFRALSELQQNHNDRDVGHNMPSVTPLHALLQWGQKQVAATK